MKHCRYCGKTKGLDNFRDRYDKRINLHYKDGKCNECAAQYQLFRYYQKREDKQFMKAAAERTRIHYYKNKDRIKQYNAERRKTPEYKEKMRLYRQSRKAIIQQQEIITKKRYHEKHRDNLTDEYIVNKLCGKDCRHLKDEFYKHPELIEAKRAQILLIRSLKNNKK